MLIIPVYDWFSVYAKRLAMKIKTFYEENFAYSCKDPLIKDKAVTFNWKRIKKTKLKKPDYITNLLHKIELLFKPHHQGYLDWTKFDSIELKRSDSIEKELWTAVNYCTYIVISF